MPMKTNIMSVKTKFSDQLIKPLHIALTHATLGAESPCIKCFILNHLLPRNLAEFVAMFPDVRARLFYVVSHDFNTARKLCAFHYWTGFQALSHEQHSYAAWI